MDINICNIQLYSLRTKLVTWSTRVRLPDSTCSTLNVFCLCIFTIHASTLETFTPAQRREIPKMVSLQSSAAETFSVYRWRDGFCKTAMKRQLLDNSCWMAFATSQSSETLESKIPLAYFTAFLDAHIPHTLFVSILNTILFFIFNWHGVKLNLCNIKTG